TLCVIQFFYLTAPATTELYTLSLHDALPIFKSLGFKYSTRGAVTVSVSDIIVPPEKGQILKEADDQVAEINGLYRMGMLSEDERDRKSTRLNSSHVSISYAVFCLKKKKKKHT